MEQGSASACTLTRQYTRDILQLPYDETQQSTTAQTRIQMDSSEQPN